MVIYIKQKTKLVSYAHPRIARERNVSVNFVLICFIYVHYILHVFNDCVVFFLFTMRFIQAFKTNLPTPQFDKPHVFNHYIPVSP